MRTKVITLALFFACPLFAHGFSNLDVNYYFIEAGYSTVGRFDIDVMPFEVGSERLAFTVALTRVDIRLDKILPLEELPWQCSFLPIFGHLEFPHSQYHGWHQAA